MSFTSLNDLLTKVQSGRVVRTDWNKVTGAVAYNAGFWYDFSGLAGTPIANAWAGTALNWVTCNESTGNGTQRFGLYHGGDVSSDFKHVMNVKAASLVATAVPGVLTLVDLQGYWPSINTNSAAVQTLSGTPSLRYANGEGCRLYFVQTTTGGATAANISYSYTNSGGTSARVPANVISMNASTIVGHIAHSGTAAFRFGPFLPLVPGDTGVQNVASVTFSAASGAGAGALCLARPLLSIPILTAGIATERDYINQMTSFPRILDGACLVWLYRAGAATAAATNFFGATEFCWG